MRYTYVLVCILFTTVLFSSCKKSDSPDQLPDRQPAVTAVGIPVGSADTKTIGTAGGFLKSADGRIELVFPAGALNANTSISIQPVTNTSPGGIGLSYHLMPDGINFSKPVNLIYHYTNEEVNGTLPFLLYIAYQDNALQWKADFKKRNIDTTARTVTLGITHFSIWSMGDRLQLFCTPPLEELHENETREIRAVLVDPSQPSNDELPPLPGETAMPASTLSNWKVNGHNGNSTDGTIAPNDNKATYKAPSDIRQRRTVQISVELKYTIVLYNNGNAVSSVNKLVLFKDLILLPSVYEFKVNIDFRDKGVSGYIGQEYRDVATFDLKITKTREPNGLEKFDAIATNIINSAPTVTPLSQTYPTPIPGSTFTYTWTPDGIGQTNITGVKVNSGADTTVNLEFLHTGTLSPGNTWSSVNPTLSGTVPSQPFGGTTGIPSGTTVILKQETQGYFPLPGGGFEIVLVPKF